MSLKVRLAGKRKPEGWAMIEPTLVEFEERLREAVNDPHEGKRKCEANWPIHRIHYERNRYIYDLYYRQEKLSRQLYEFLVREKVVDGALISKWRKPGYEILCSMSAIQKGNTNFGTTSICRVPLAQRGGQIMPSTGTGCVSCVSGDGINGGPVWWTDPYTAWAAKKKSDRKQQRRAEERMKRWDAAERRPEPPPAYLQLERVYKSQVKELKARLKLSEAQRAAAEANAELSDALKLKAEYLLACSAV